VNDPRYRLPGFVAAAPPQPRRFAALLLPLAVSVFVSAGCSWIFVDGPPDE
jgi:hypothetical protein